MIDTRCYKCIKDTSELYDIDFDPYKHRHRANYSYMIYQGNGIFKCPRCGDVNNLSNKTYITKISRTYDEDGTLISNILEFDHKLNQEGEDAFKQDMLELDIFDDIPWGKYILEVLWYYYECSGLDGPEWDVKIEILSEKVMQ